VSDIKPFVLSVIVQNVVMLSVVVPVWKGLTGANNLLLHTHNIYIYIYIYILIYVYIYIYEKYIYMYLYIYIVCVCVCVCVCVADCLPPSSLSRLAPGH
jgi:hypothetical protein